MTELELKQKEYRDKLAHDYLCASISSGIAWTSDQYLIEAVFNLTDKFIKYANNNLSCQ